MISSGNATSCVWVCDIYIQEHSAEALAEALGASQRLLKAGLIAFWTVHRLDYRDCADNERLRYSAMHRL
ncbi:LOW QUALITY PROTEIN: hypothetical protein PHMEG_00012829 [Phytophthora megakarya]|uniref:Uncharacterized protein n=1 Tax=Phytophthora megakarya TaxID=4795 RepID=A0A225W9X3_9STRA|nr:LOW QUALITY PROTEIN: hypothetical protein PHMEG_00012829 [Phytophthora megakarya]